MEPSHEVRLLIHPLSLDSVQDIIQRIFCLNQQLPLFTTCPRNPLSWMHGTDFHFLIFYCKLAGDMDSQDQATPPPPLSDPPSLEAMEGTGDAPQNLPLQQEQPQPHSDDSQMDDTLQEVSSHSSSQMPELEQMEGGPEQIVEEDQSSQSAPDVEAMEVGETLQVNPPPPQIVIIEEQIPATTDVMIEATPTSSEPVPVLVAEEQVSEDGQVLEVAAPAVAEAAQVDEQVDEGIQEVQDVEQEVGEVVQEDVLVQNEEQAKPIASEDVKVDQEQDSVTLDVITEDSSTKVSEDVKVDQEQDSVTLDVVTEDSSAKEAEASDQATTQATVPDKVEEEKQVEERQPEEDETKDEGGKEPAQKKAKLDPSDDTTTKVSTVIH